jgi:hypothetical protein
MALASFLHLRKPQTLQEQRAERIYAGQVREITARVTRVFDDWTTLRETEFDNERLANSAAVSRWELMLVVKNTERLTPPRSMLTTQRDLHNAVVGAARACQLLANGYRAYKSEAVCDGQAMLVEVLEDINGLVEQLQMR